LESDQIDSDVLKIFN